VCGDRCNSGALFPPVPCADGLACVITKLGNLPVDLPDTGTCESVEAPTAACDATLCDDDDTAVCTLGGRTVTCAAFTEGPGSPDVPFLTPSPGDMPEPSDEPEPHDCATEEVWTAAKTKWCCANKGLGCPTATPSPVDCDADGLDVFARGRCCREEGKACAEAGESCCVGGNCGFVPPVPCAEGLDCLGEPPVNGNPPIAGRCGTPSPAPTPSAKPEPYNCYTKELWTPAKTRWCCANKGLGCPVETARPTPVPAVNKCEGVMYKRCASDRSCPRGQVCVEKRDDKASWCSLRSVSGNFYCTAVDCRGGRTYGYGRYGPRMGHCSPKLG